MTQKNESTSKITYWEKYGVKRFPYRGKRKYTPLIYQSDDGGIIISNDVFGLTIRQFERMYKDCLDKRKTHESWIMNLRYPDKASNEYLEYLNNCTDCNKEYLSWTENSSIENHLVNHLIRTIGTEIDIRKRQLLFILHDKLYSTNDKNLTQISSGSLAEGLDLPGSDEDKMFVDDVVNVTQIERNIKHPVQRTEVFMETDTDHPGFTRLRLIAAGKRFYYASISQHSAQLFPPPNTNYNIRTCYHRHLQNGIRSDALTGWLLYASFHYVTDQYNETLRLTEYVLSKCLPDMLYIKKSFYTEEDKNNYRHNVHSKMTMNAKMKTAVVSNVYYSPHSSLIPQELEMEVEDTFFMIPPSIMSHCLRFLCYHHIGDTVNRQQALRHLCSLHYVTSNVFSNCLTLFGVCCEIAGYNDAAFHYYDKALQCVDCICSSAEKRKSRLLNI
ncbi:Hypothetical predicted protein [Mytilus galloprovincialis]|uniref:Uncharacterized protein n=1 Tax=Mytilus galloprovincialis TaxID=29158 RepID=A0A8B6G208_MYTGA|nr:Hypothetical predicted protein [Mytilus galloprovincialis]